MKLWLVTAIGVAVCLFLLIFIGGAILIEGNRVYHLFKASTEGTGAPFNAMLLYVGLWNFAGPFAAVTAVVGLVSGPFMMIGKGGKSAKMES